MDRVLTASSTQSRSNGLMPRWVQRMCSANWKFPVATGTPWINQLSAPEGELTERPEGNEPLSSVLVATPVAPQVPPLTDSCWLYETPGEPAGNDSVAIRRGPAA